MTQTIIVAIIVLAAVVWAVWSMVRRAGRGGCASCDVGASCPHASKGVCPSEDLQVCNEIVENEQSSVGEDASFDE